MRGRTPLGRGANPALDALTDARFVLALAVLVLNDHVWKAAYGNWLTGKLSDFAGLIVLPVVLATALRLIGATDRVRTTAVVVGSWFALLKTSHLIAGWTEGLAETLTGWSHTIVLDPTDLVGLVALPVAVAVLRTPRPLVDANVVRAFAFAVGLLAVMATSNDYSIPPTDLAVDTVTGDVRAFGGESDSMVDGAEEVEASAERFTGIGEKVLTMCDPAEPGRCFAAEQDRIVEQVDGRSETVWSRDPTSPFKGDVQDVGYEVDRRRLNTHVVDMAYDDRGVLHVVSLDGVRAERSIHGAWSPPFGNFRPIAIPAAMASIITLLSVSAVAMRRQSTGLVVVAPLASLSYFVLMPALGGESPGNVVGLLVSFALCSAAAILLVFLGYGLRARWLFVVPVILGVMYLDPRLAWAMLPLTGVGLLAMCVAAIFTYGPQDKAAMAIAATCVAAVAAIVPYVAWRLFIDVTYKWTYLWMAIMVAAMVFVDRLGLEKIPAPSRPIDSEVSSSEN